MKLLKNLKIVHRNTKIVCKKKRSNVNLNKHGLYKKFLQMLTFKTTNISEAKQYSYSLKFKGFKSPCTLSEGDTHFLDYFYLFGPTFC